MIDGRNGASQTPSSRTKRASRAIAALALTGGLCASFYANAAPLEVRDIQVQSRHTFSYTCANSKTFKVTYLNAANGQSFALVPVNGRKLLFVGVIAASGVKYVADRYTWWTKGPGADLYDVTSDASPKPVLSGCATIMR
jgi:membrane-bound inhibitor of C-type lysozyme